MSATPEVPPVAENEELTYTVDLGRSSSTMKDSDFSFGLRIQHPKVGTVKDLSMAVHVPTEGMILVKVPTGLIAFNQREKANIAFKAGNSSFEFLLQPEEEVMLTEVESNKFKNWEFEDSGVKTNLDKVLTEMYTNSDRVPPADSYQLRLCMAPDSGSCHNGHKKDHSGKALSFDIICSKLPQGQTWYFDIKLLVLAENVLCMKESGRFLLLNQTREDIRLENKGTFYLVNPRGLGMFEDLNVSNSKKHVIHLNNNSKVTVADALKQLQGGNSVQEKSQSVPKDEPMSV